MSDDRVIVEIGAEELLDGIPRQSLEERVYEPDLGTLLGDEPIRPAALGATRQGRWFKGVLQDRGLDLDDRAPAISWYYRPQRHSYVFSQIRRPPPFRFTTLVTA